MGREQGFEAASQVLVADAGIVEKRGTRWADEQGRSLEQGLFVGRVHGLVGRVGIVHPIQRFLEAKSMRKDLAILFGRRLRLSG